MSLIVFFWRTRCTKDLLYLFDIANSHGRIGEQVRGDIENGLKFLHNRPTYDGKTLNHHSFGMVFTKGKLEIKGKGLHN